MKKLAKRMFLVLLVITMFLFVVACGGDDPVQEATPEPTPTAELTPEPTPVPTPTVEPTTEPIPEETPEPGVAVARFPFSFSSVDLQGNTVTDEDLGEKELFFAYLWAVW